MPKTEPKSEPKTDQQATQLDDLEREQQYLSSVYRKLDAERELTQRRLSEGLQQSGGTPQARSERDVSITMYTDRIAQLNSVEQGLCFGRLDFRDESERVYIGRLGLFDEENDYTPLLIDWRAPVARPFYLATAASPQGVLRRRHLRTLSRKVVALDDEVLDLASTEQGQDLGLVGEATLLAALNRGRTGEMGDIVATIQAEQDDIIRDDLTGILVVQGGPGTGKTAVALHRVAYLLYTYRRQLMTRGVLVIGPNSAFLRYISQVLPTLGETGVLLSTIGELYPGVVAHGVDTRQAEEVKGRLSMVEVLAKAVADRQTVPEETLEIHAEDEILQLPPEVFERARARARATQRPHNLARRVFVDQLLDVLAAHSAEQLESNIFAGVPDIPLAEDESADDELLDQQDLTAIRAELASDHKVLSTLDSLWPVLTPQEVLTDLFSSSSRLTSAAEPFLTEEDRLTLFREAGAKWTSADVPLLDELAELLGEDDTEARAAQARKEVEDRAYAEGVLHVLEQDEEIIDEEVLRVRDVLDAELFAERQVRQSDLTAAQRAAKDRTWSFGHVIVDEAQELSPLAWRLVMRRCPSRSMTLVGDVAQTGSPAGASSWDEMLRPYVSDRWRLRELTVNYRTPAEIMGLAADVLAEVDPALQAPSSVRQTGVRPLRFAVKPTELLAEIQSIVESELGLLDVGTIAVLCPVSQAATIFAALTPNPQLSVLSVQQAKGLEFDAVVVVSPEFIVRESPRGWNDLYVALTRATQRLTIVHGDTILPALSGAEQGERSSR